MQKKTTANYLIPAIILLSVFLCYFINIAYLPLWDPDEPYYVEAGREMIQKNDYITPFFNYEPRLNKPIFFYWLQIFSGKIFGFNEFSARFPSFICGIALLWLIYKLGSLLYNKKTGLTAALISATSFEVYVLSRQAVTDMCLAFFMTLAIYGYASVQAEKQSEGKWYLFYIGTAFAVITKGPVGLLLPGGVIFIIMLIQKDFTIIKRMKVLKGILIFILIASPWYMAVLLKNGFHFFKVFIIENNLLRYVTPMYKHTGGIYYYIPVLILGFFPWIVLLVTEAGKNFNSLKSKKIAINDKKSGEAFALLLNIVWFSVYFLFFSFSGSKLPAYILGLFPALALFLASSLMVENKKKKSPSRLRNAFHYGYFWLLVIALMIIFKWAFFQNWSTIIPIVVILLIIAILTNVKKIRVLSSLLPDHNGSIFSSTVITTGFLFLTANLFLFPAMADYFPIKNVGEASSRLNFDKSAIIAYRYYEPSMVFYSGNKVVYAEHQEDLLKLIQDKKISYFFATIRHFRELPSSVQDHCSILSYGIRYRNRLRNFGALFSDRPEIVQNRALLLIRYSAGGGK